jgi:peptide/nickel transport system substrate-binding protein
MRTFTRLAAVLLTATTIGFPAAAEAQDAKKTVKVIPLNALRTIDIHANSNGVIRMHALAVYDTLFSWDSRLEIKPQMVEAYSVSDDKLTYRFTLRPGLKFHDGTPVTTKDVIPSLQRWMARDTLGTKMRAFLASLDAVDDRTFTMKLKEPFGFVQLGLGAVAGMAPSIMREKEAKTDPHTLITEVVGSGPFRFVRAEWDPGSKAVYERFADYVPRSEAPDGHTGGKVVKIDRTEWIVMPDAATAAAAMAKGEMDFWDGPPLDLIPVVSANKDLVVEKMQPFPFFAGFRPNALHPPFNDPRARQAFALAVDQTKVMQAAIGDQKWWRTCYAYYMCGAPFGTEVGSDAYRTSDLTKAKQLLAESGYKGEPVVLLGTTEIAIINAEMQMAADAMRSIGINVQTQVNDWGTVLTRQADKSKPGPGSSGWNVVVTYFSGVTNFHPLTNIATNMACDASNWAGWPCDQEAERLRDALARAPDANSQKAALEAFHKRLWEVVPLVLAGQFDQPSVYRRNLDGFLKASSPVFWNVVKN